MNILLGIISILLCFTTIVLIEKLFKKEGLYIWICLATITANILVCKTIDILGFTSTLGNIMFSSIFLATDIMTEKYGTDDSKKAIFLGIVSTIIFVVSTQISLFFIPNNTDIAQESMETLFKLNLRTSISSIAMYFLSTIANILLFDKLKEKFPNKLWVRSNISTILTNCTENYFFVFLAFVGIFDIYTILSIATITCILEIIIAICDTPFIYIATHTKN